MPTFQNKDTKTNLEQAKSKNTHNPALERTKNLNTCNKNTQQNKKNENAHNPVSETNT